MKKVNGKNIATWIIVPLMISVFLLDIVSIVAGNVFAKRFPFEKEDFSYKYGDDRIHFLNTANSDCILIESNGRFGLVDSGEGTGNPRRKLPYEGYTQQVIDYLKKVAADDSGKAHLDFVLATHYHYDHVGSFDAIINCDDILIDTAYFKKYDPSMDTKLESTDWGLPGVYETIIKDLKNKGIKLVQDIPERIEFGDFTLELFNTVNYDDLKGIGENSASIGIKVIKGTKSAFLAADITSESGLEEKLGDRIGHVDLLKIGHHGYYGSSSMSFLDKLTPEVAVVTNYQGKVYPNVKWNLTMHSHIPFYGTHDNNGIIAAFTDDNNIVFTNDIH